MQPNTRSQTVAPKHLFAPEWGWWGKWGGFGDGEQKLHVEDEVKEIMCIYSTTLFGLIPLR